MTTKLVPVFLLALFALAILSVSMMIVNLGPALSSVQSIKPVTGIDKAPVVSIPNEVPQVDVPEVSEPIEVPQVDTRNSHAETKHGVDEATLIRDCLGKNGSLLTMYFKGSTHNKHVRICQLESGEFGLQFLKEGSTGKTREITAFIRRQANSLKDVMDYLMGTGYVP